MSDTQDVEALVARAEVKSAMLRMGERIAFGSDADMIDELATALRTLARERDEARRAWNAYHVEYNLLEAQLAGAKEALEPFADAAAFYDPDEGDGKDIAWSHDFTIGSLRRARAVYEALASAPASAPSEADMRAFGASDVAAYKWPDDTPEHRAARVAYCEGAADAAPASAGVGDAQAAMSDIALIVAEWRNGPLLSGDAMARIRSCLPPSPEGRDGKEVRLTPDDARLLDKALTASTTHLYNTTPEASHDR